MGMGFRIEVVCMRGSEWTLITVGSLACVPLPPTAAPPRPPAPPQIDLDDDIFKVDFMKIFGEPERALTPSQYQGIHLPERGRVSAPGQEWLAQFAQWSCVEV